MSKSPSDIICFVRHGAAEDDHVLGDSARGLTADGRTAFRDHAAALAGHVELVGIATSPLVRAVQTAEILAEAMGLDEIQVDGALRYPGASAGSIEGLARELGLGWALVGHNPSMGEALAHLTGGTTAVRFRKGAVAALAPGEHAKRPWQLAWLREPGRKPRHDFD